MAGTFERSTQQLCNNLHVIQPVVVLIKMTAQQAQLHEPHRDNTSIVKPLLSDGPMNCWVIKRYTVFPDPCTYRILRGYKKSRQTQCGIRRSMIHLYTDSTLTPMVSPRRPPATPAQRLAQDPRPPQRQPIGESNRRQFQGGHAQRGECCHAS